MLEQKILTPVAPLVLAGEQYLLAKNGAYSLHRPKTPDPFGIVAHEAIETLDDSGLTVDEIHALVQLLGTYIEENDRLKKAVEKGAE